MSLLVLGSTGLLGQAVTATARARGIEVTGAARSGADRALDVTDAGELIRVLGEVAPENVVNCVALVDLSACEADPGRAYTVNARPAGIVAEWASAHASRLVQISTDHLWTGDGRGVHDEDAPPRLLNEYARSKLAAEALALAAPAALVVRTNIVGARGWEGRPTFAEWAVAALRAGEEMTLFDDFFTSSMTAGACAEAVLDLLEADVAGVINVASAEVASKKEFVEALARALALEPPRATAGSVTGLQPPRAESLGLDVARAEAALGRALPGLEETVQELAAAMGART